MKTSTTPRLLYVEDNEDSSLIINLLFSLYNIEVISAKTVKDALQLASDERFDLYLLDILLPDGNGIELCRQLHRLNPQTPIVFYSALDIETNKQKGIEAGAVAYLKKPLVDDLMTTIEHLIASN